MAGVTDGNSKSKDTESINTELVLIKTAYQDRNASNHLKIVSRETTDKPYDLYMEWIK